MSRKSLSTKERTRIFLLHGGVCHFCRTKINGVREQWEISHEIPLELGGADDDENRKPAHYRCHRKHTAEVDLPAIAKAKRTRAKHIGAFRRSGRPLAGTKASGIRKRMNGDVERW